LAGFVAWLTGHRLRRVAFIAGMFPLPVTSVFSAAIVVLTADLKGLEEALKDIALAFAGLGLMAVLSGSDPMPLLTSAALSWVIAALLGGVGHKYRSFTLVVQAALLLTIAGMVLFLLLVGDAEAFWKAWLQQAAADFVAEGVGELDQSLIDQLASFMTTGMAVSLLISSLIAVSIGSSWACASRNESFGERFRQLKLGYVIGGLAAALGLAALAGFETAGGMLIAVSIGFLLQGLAVLCSWAKHKSWPGSWWAAIIVPLVLLMVVPVPAILIAFGLVAIGFIDNWYSLRPRT